MGSLLEKFAGKIDLIYIDPPFATGADFSFTTPIGESGEEVTKEQSVIEEKAYRDTWGRGLASYLDMLSQRLPLMRDLLSESGSVIVHLDAGLGHYVKVLLDSLFGQENFLNEIIWSYSTSGRPADRYPQKHDDLYWYRKGGHHAFFHDEARIPYSAEYLDTHFTDVDDEGRHCRKRFDAGKWRVYYPDRGMLPNAVWEIPYVNSQAVERTGYPTQKPEPLLERLIKAMTQSENLVADFFCGSGTTLAVAEKLGRRWSAATWAAGEST
jgi:adenine specific DNA methylase Mod